MTTEHDAMEPMQLSDAMLEGVVGGLDELQMKAVVYFVKAAKRNGLPSASTSKRIACVRSSFAPSTSYSRESRFVKEIPDKLLNKTGESKRYSFGTQNGTNAFSSDNERASSVSSRFSTYQKPAAKSGVTYSVGDSVLHKVFGKGLVMSAEKMGNDTLLEIAFDKVGTKKLMANFCKMEKL